MTDRLKHNDTQKSACEALFCYAQTKTLILFLMQEKTPWRYAENIFVKHAVNPMFFFA